MKTLTQMRIVRLEQQVTLSELGELVGVDHTAMSRIERGQWAVNTDRAKEIARVLGVAVTDLFSEEDGRLVAVPRELVATA